MISKKTKYALKALIHLSREQDKGPILIGHIAREERIPQKFLEAILLDLRNAGVLGSKKGKGGGYYMLKKPAEVTMIEVMRLFDGPVALLPCVSFKYYQRCDECKDEAACGIRAAFADVRNATVEILKRYTLAELISKEKDLCLLVGNDVLAKE